MARWGWLMFAVAASAGCRLNFDLSEGTRDGGGDDGGTPDGSGNMDVRVAERIHSPVVATLTTSTVTITPGSTLVVLMWSSSNIQNGTASDPIAGPYVPEPTLTTVAAYATQDVWVVENHPGGQFAISLSWPMANVVELFVLEVMNVRPQSIDVTDAAASNNGPVFSSPTVTTQVANDLLLVFDTTDAVANESVMFTSGETLVAHTMEPTGYPGAIGARRLGPPGMYSSTIMQATGTRGFVSMLALAPP